MAEVSDLFSALTMALQSYAQTLTKSPVTKVSFELEPGGRQFDADGLQIAWVAKARLKGRDLKVPEPESPDTEYLEGAEEVEVASFEWKAKGDNFPEAVEGLVAEVEKDLSARMRQQSSDLAAAQSAVRALQNPTELSDLWPTRDPAEPVVEDG
jgi:hypothetical protein